MAPVDGTLHLAAAGRGVSHRIGRLNVMKWRGWNMAVGLDGNRNHTTDDDAGTGLSALDAHHALARRCEVELRYWQLSSAPRQDRYAPDRCAGVVPEWHCYRH